MKDKLLEQYSVYLQNNNKVFENNVLSICYKPTKEEIELYSLTSTYILILVYSDKINILSNKKANYLKELNKIFDNSFNLRVQCECLLGIYGDSHCDCESQRIKYLDLIKKRGGIFIHFPQEAQGWGLHYKLKELELQVNGKLQNSDFIGRKNRDEAQKIINNTNSFEDKRGYQLIAKILKDLNLNNRKIFCMSNNVNKIEELRNEGLDVEKFEDNDKIEINSENLSEYLIKILNDTHKLSNKEFDVVIDTLKDSVLNDRTKDTLKKIKYKIDNRELILLNDEQIEKMNELFKELICRKDKICFVTESETLEQKYKYCGKVKLNVFNELSKIHKKNIFSRIQFEQIFIFKNILTEEKVKVRKIKILETNDSNYFNNQTFFIERKTGKNNKVTQSIISQLQMESYFENNDYEYIRRLENVAYYSKVSENAEIVIKKIPKIENYILCIYGNRDEIIRIINELDAYSILIDTFTNLEYKNEEYSNFNLKFGNSELTIKSELEFFNILKNNKY